MKATKQRRGRRRGWSVSCAAAMCLLLLPGAGVPRAARAQAANVASASKPGAAFSAQQLSNMLPASVYYAGKSASLQMRNAGGTRFADGAVVWVALVDSSGYASSVQNTYQFYLVTESSLRIGDKLLPAGAYGGGFVGGNHFVVLDIGGHQILQGDTKMDEAMKRPRPLQIVAESPDAVRLYLGRRWLTLQAAGGAKQ